MITSKNPSRLVANIGHNVDLLEFHRTKAAALNPDGARLCDTIAAAFDPSIKTVRDKIGIPLHLAPEAAIDEFSLTGRIPRRVDKFCSMCANFEPVDLTGGECRSSGPSRTGAGWPRVARTEWCGRFRPCMGGR